VKNEGILQKLLINKVWYIATTKPIARGNNHSNKQPDFTSKKNSTQLYNCNKSSWIALLSIYQSNNIKSIL